MEGGWQKLKSTKTYNRHELIPCDECNSTLQACTNKIFRNEKNQKGYAALYSNVYMLLFNFHNQLI